MCSWGAWADQHSRYINTLFVISTASNIVVKEISDKTELFVIKYTHTHTHTHIFSPFQLVSYIKCMIMCLSIFSSILPPFQPVSYIKCMTIVCLTIFSINFIYHIRFMWVTSSAWLLSFSQWVVLLVYLDEYSNLCVCVCVCILWRTIQFCQKFLSPQC